MNAEPDNIAGINSDHRVRVLIAAYRHPSKFDDFLGLHLTGPDCY
jgi:hypothetical protein